MRGIVDFIKINKVRPKRCYGFISAEGKMFYFQPNNFNVKVGDCVEFTGGQDEKGYFAEGIQVVV